MRCAVTLLRYCYHHHKSLDVPRTGTGTHINIVLLTIRVRLHVALTALRVRLCIGLSLLAVSSGRAEVLRDLFVIALTDLLVSRIYLTKLI